ncbi:MAG: hypothetical protein GVX90_05750 [Alphaproteobacteria bacterium]|jgi:branched-subunit amino acid aminotransferase/4-amino-4-deoxychorismate lyase|nr:hypothetical protein [Alphaproteobacteria bacterium]
MSDHPSTYGGTPEKSGETAWQDRAALHAVDDGDGIFDGAKAIRRGTFAEMIRHIAALPENERGRYLIEKSGDREYSAEEAIELSQRADFPARP